MTVFSVELLGLRIFVSIIGIMGNVFLILSLAQTKFSRVKPFEFFLLGLAASNLETLVIVDIYDLTMLTESSISSTWVCQSLKFLTVFGETSSILFTVLISIFRYQKLRDGNRRVNLPVFLDSIRSAWMVSVFCVTLALLLSAPIYDMNTSNNVDNLTSTSSGCPLDFFQCYRDHCPAKNLAYKYFFILVSNLLPLLIVTATGCLIITVLLSQQRMITPALSVSTSQQSCKRSKYPRFQRSTLAVLAAMVLFQVEWTLYLVFHLAFSPDDFRFWSEIEFFIATSYTTGSPYVYGIGNNIFSLKNFRKK
ncbi:uncharacterized protein ora6 [Myripristis murdjan]|uniref:uncharacterized protein ora6 n=1 Tax=Myripristis murdjan TaxID=586833 RepID=UPI001176290B|nr:uncharacterized protein LOC115356294 [Myripristis murdjan]